MKILYVITGLSQGGAERVVCNLADKMYEEGNQVKIAYLTGKVLTFPIHEEIELVKLNLNSFGSFLPAYMTLSKLIKSYRPDIVHSHMVHANILARLVRLAAPMDKLISTAHSSNEGGRSRMFLYRITHKLADITTNVSQEATHAFEYLGAVPHDGMITVYNGVDLDRFKYSSHARAELDKELGLNKNHKIILAVGRFDDVKDYPGLLEAIKLFKLENIFPFKLVVAGDGELRGAIEEKIDKLSLHEDVILLGRRNDISKLMSAADLFVLSSKFEGFGLVVIEAMASECLIVATDCGGVAEALNSPDFLVPPNNSIALADKMTYALSLDENKKSAVIQKNRNYIENNFSLESVVEKWIILYNEK